MIQNSPFSILGQSLGVGREVNPFGITHTVCRSHLTLLMRLFICHLTPSGSRDLTTHLFGDFSHLKQSTLKVKWRPMGQQSFEYSLKSRSILVALPGSGSCPFFNGVGILGAELASAPSVIPDFSMSSRDLLEGVDCLLGPSVSLLDAGTDLGALLDPPAPADVGLLGLFFFLLAS